MADASRGVSRGSLDVRILQDIEFDFQLYRSLGAVSYEGGTVGEILSLVPHIDCEDPSTWVKSFKDLATRLKNHALKVLQKGNSETARQEFLRAASYFRAAEYFGDPRDSKTRYIGMESRDCFVYAFRTTDIQFEAERIPYGEDFIPAYWIAPTTGGTKKTIIMMSGFDGTSEEMYFQAGSAALQRGYAVVLFDGPGQVGMRRFSPETPLRPDYEVPISKVVDYALSKEDVDPSRLALYGISLGGYFSLRAAAHDSRIRALISNSPVTDIYKYLSAFAGEAINSPEDITLETVDLVPSEYLSKAQKLQLVNIMLRFGEVSMFKAFERMRDFVVGNAIKSIQVPFLAMVGEGEGEEALIQAREALDNVSGKSTMRIFKKQEGADSHCQVTNLPLSNSVLLDWLDDVFGATT